MTEEELLANLDPGGVPRHIAVIMDGNGRWARQQGLDRIEGHRASIQSIHEAVSGCSDLGVKFLTLYAFSTENWSRSPEEIAALMMLIEISLEMQTPSLHARNVIFQHLGRREGLPQSLLDTFDGMTKIMEANTGLTLQLAVNYGGRQEILEAAVAMAREIAAGALMPEQVVEADLTKHFYRPETPDPDLLIRTGGEMRVSNYLLWEIAYSEIWVTPVLWPDFRKPHLYQAIADFQGRQRRFGGVKDGA
jgi:undecaprenyl diphosphate synthase